MASAIVGNISMYLGEDLPLIDQIYEADGVTPQNVAGWSAEFIIHAPDDPGTVLITKSTGAGSITPVNPSPPTVAYNWAFSLTVAHADTVDADGRPVVTPQQSYGYRYVRTDTGNVTVVTTGLFSIVS